jgi:hypothetical protein
MNGIVHNSDYKLVGSLVIPTGGYSDIQPTPDPDIPDSWGDHGPNAAIDFDTERNNKLQKAIKGKVFSGVTRGLGRVRI